MSAGSTSARLSARGFEDEYHLVDPHTFNILSLCTGAGGLDLGLRLAQRDARTICHVEIEAYACEVLAARMEEACLDDAPLWTDLGTFDGRPWRGAFKRFLVGEDPDLTVRRLSSCWMARSIGFDVRMRR